MLQQGLKVTVPWSVLKGFGFAPTGTIPRSNTGLSQVARFAEVTDPPCDTVKFCVGQNGETAACADIALKPNTISSRRRDQKPKPVAQLFKSCVETNCISTP